MRFNAPVTESAPLKRSLSLPLITFYGLGTVIGAGIYALAGKFAGLYTPVAFPIATVLVLGFPLMGLNPEARVRHRRRIRALSSHL